MKKNKIKEGGPQRTPTRAAFSFSSSADRGGAVSRDSALQAGSSWVQFLMGLLGFLIAFIFSATLWPGGRIRISMGGRELVRKSDNLTILMCLLSINYEGLTTLQP